MRNAVIGIVVSMCILVTAVIVASIQINDDMRDQVAVVLDTAICSTQRVFYDKQTRPESQEEYLAEFNKNLYVLIGESSRGEDGEKKIQYNVDVYSADCEKGLLDVQLRAKYRNILGQWREAKERKTMIIEVIDA